MTQTYKTGTVAVTNNVAQVTGTGTAWVVAAVAGGMFSCNGLAVPITSVDSDTQITLDYPWPGTNGTGQAYSIARENSQAANLVDFYTKLANLLSVLTIAGIHPNGSGTLAARNALTLTAANDGYWWLRAEFGIEFAFYRWNGTTLAWEGPYAWYGLPGSANVVGTSPTSFLIGTGSKTFVINEASRGWGIGARLRVSSTASPSNWMEGVVTNYGGNNLTVNVDLVGGAGTFANWTVNISGQQGAGMVASVNGATGAVIIDQPSVDAQSTLRTSVAADANYTILATDRMVCQTAALTAPRTWTLPAANAYKAGKRLVLKDESASLTIANTLSIIPAGTDSLNTTGNQAAIVLDYPLTAFELESDGVSMWSVINLGGRSTRPHRRAALGLGSGNAATDGQGLRYNAALQTFLEVAQRAVLAASVTYYVGYNLGAASVSIASPGVVTLNAHGLVAGSRASFSILPNTTAATVSVASPAVVTMTNTFAAGQPIVFASTGRLPKGLVAGTTYYVIATGLSGASFQVSATVGGAAINTSNPTFTVTIASPGVVTETGHGRSTGDAIQLSTTGALPTGLAAATTYFINVIDANTYNLRLTPEGANINTSGTQSGTHSIVQFGTHYLSQTGTLPTGITAGQDYYVLATGLTTNTFQFSATLGGAAINTSGSTAGTIVCKTGSDNNNGLAQTAAGAFLTVQKAIDTIASLDLSIYNAVIQIADGMYTGANALKNAAGFSITGALLVQGNNTFPANALLSTTSAHCFSADGTNVIWDLRDLKMQTTTAGNCIDVQNGATVRYQNVDFGACAATHVNAQSGAKARSTGNYKISGGASVHISSTYFSLILDQGVTITMTGVPAFGFAFATAQQNAMLAAATNTFNGFSTGTRFYVSGGGNLFTNGAGASYFPGSIAGTGTNFGVSPYGLYS